MAQNSRGLRRLPRAAGYRRHRLPGGQGSGSSKGRQSRPPPSPRGTGLAPTLVPWRRDDWCRSIQTRPSPSCPVNRRRPMISRLRPLPRWQVIVVAPSFLDHHRADPFGRPAIRDFMGYHGISREVNGSRVGDWGPASPGKVSIPLTGAPRWGDAAALAGRRHHSGQCFETSKRCQSACKPGSVWRRFPAARRPFIWGVRCRTPRATNPGD